MLAHLDDRIASAGFASGDRFVIGDWQNAPIGPMHDMMWATAEGERVLLAPDDRVAEFVSSVYVFDRIDVVPFKVTGDRRGFELHAGPVQLSLATGFAIRVPSCGRAGSRATWRVRSRGCSSMWRRSA